MCSIPLIRPAVSPNPQTLIGFATYAEAKAAQEFCLAAPIPDIIEWQQELLEREDVVCLAMRDPEPPTSGATMWTEGEPPEKRLAQQYTR